MNELLNQLRDVESKIEELQQHHAKLAGAYVTESAMYTPDDVVFIPQYGDYGDYCLGSVCQPQYNIKLKQIVYKGYKVNKAGERDEHKNWYLVPEDKIRRTLDK